jgi:predicted DNA-binding transcriptional regulator YafY
MLDMITSQTYEADEIQTLAEDADPSMTVQVEYINAKGEQKLRTILPVRIFFGQTEWHQDDQWFLECWDFGKNEVRHFAMANIMNWPTHGC